MKIRTNFVSNSSSSSFIIQVLNQQHAKVLINILANYADTFISLEESIKEIQTTIKEYRATDYYGKTNTPWWLVCEEQRLAHLETCAKDEDIYIVNIDHNNQSLHDGLRRLAEDQDIAILEETLD